MSMEAFSMKLTTEKERLAALADAPRKKYANPEDYYEELRLWLRQAYFWQSVTAAFPYYLMHRQLPSTQVQPQARAAPAVRPPPPPQPETNYEGIQCRIPSFWKRIVAELIDFLVLFLLKLGVTYVAVDIFDIIDLDRFYVFQKEAKLEYKTLLKLPEDIVMLELVHRIIVCLFETLWLAGSPGRIGGASPGKSVMGLRVVRCDLVTNAPPLPDGAPGAEMVLVCPGTNLGLSFSFIRSAVKNFILAVLIPTSFGLFYFPYNRTGYDIICGSIVVEEPIVVQQRQPH